MIINTLRGQCSLRLFGAPRLTLRHVDREVASCHRRPSLPSSTRQQRRRAGRVAPSRPRRINRSVDASPPALTTESAEIKWLSGVSLATTFEGEFSDVTQSYAGKGVVRYTW